MCHCTDYKLSALQVRISEENKLNATTQQLIIAKISGCALKQGSKTHSSLGQNSLQLQNEAALMSFEYEQSSIESVRLDWLVHNAGLQGRILLNCTRIANAHYARTISNFYV